MRLPTMLVTVLLLGGCAHNHAEKRDAETQVKASHIGGSPVLFGDRTEYDRDLDKQDAIHTDGSMSPMGVQ